LIQYLLSTELNIERGIKVDPVLTEHRTEHEKGCKAWSSINWHTERGIKVDPVLAEHRTEHREV